MDEKESLLPHGSGFLYHYVTMLMEVEKERLVGDILGASFESVTLDDLSREVLPFIERVFDTSASVLYRCGEHGEMLPLGGSHRRLAFEYREEYVLQDPMQGALRRLNPKIQIGSRLQEWKEYVKLPVYTEFAKRCQIETYIHVRIADVGYQQPGMIGLLLARSLKQPHFDDGDELILRRILPALDALARRSKRHEKEVYEKTVMEAMLQLSARPLIALDLKGQILWVSEEAEKWIDLRNNGRWMTPASLADGARRLGEIVAKRPHSLAKPAPYVLIHREGKTPLQVELRILRTRSGEPFILAEIDAPVVSSPLAEAAARHGLTASETEVLRLISLGLSEEAVSRRLFVSRATIHTHTVRIFAKLRVHSRVQAALVALGIKPQNE
ncbi:MAG TPA: LuxR C-terminal-related transcriptional regulator [bacterium]|nr:LuxR C-terminal-related transcriptional regulator [bacterium]